MGMLFRFTLMLVFPLFELLETIQFAMMSTKYSGGVFLEFACKKDRQTRQDSNGVVDKEEWDSVLAFAVDVGVDMSLVHSVIFAMVGQAIADYSRRISTPLRSWPLRIFQLVKSEHDVSCAQRQCVCRELRDLADSEVGNSVAKVRKYWCDTISDCISSGKIAYELWIFMYEIGRSLKFDTQDVEGNYNVLLDVSKRSPCGYMY